MAGGAGSESYFGYAVPDSGDLTSQNWRRYDIWWDQCRYALEFFRANNIPFQNMTNRNDLLSGAASGGPYCFATNGQIYVAYFAGSTTPSLDLSGVTGSFSVHWFDPFNGGGLQTGSVTQVTGGGMRNFGIAPASITKDKVVLVRRIPPPDTTPPSVSIVAPTNGASLFANIPLTVSSTVTDDVAVAFVELWVDGVLQPPVMTSTTYDFTISGLSLGAHTLGVVGEDTSTNRTTNSVSVTMVSPEPPSLSLVSTGSQWQLEWTAPGFQLDHASQVTGPWTSIFPSPTSPYPISTTNAEAYFRLRWTSL
jgi:hypothetical protein